MNKKRLEKLAEHLEAGKLAHKIFDFSICNENGIGKDFPLPEQCGTIGCALGELPALFPRSWIWSVDNTRGIVLLKNAAVSCDDMYADATVFFDIGDAAVKHLFLPFEQEPEKYGGKHLTDEATPKQVAANIRSFIKNYSSKTGCP